MVYRNRDPLAMEESLKLLRMIGYGDLIKRIKELKELIEEDRRVRVKEKLENFRKKLQNRIELNGLMESLFGDESATSCDVPSLADERALAVMNGFLPDSEDIGFGNVHEIISTKSISLPKVERIPRYKTWVLSKRNQLMAEDQSVIGRKRIYYDQCGGKALICSDSEEDVPEAEAQKIEFSEGEDRILCMAFQELGLEDVVAEVVSHFIRGTPLEIKKRFNEVKLKYKASKEEGSSESKDKFVDRSLNAALDTFDNLFCRRCYVFDCRVHGCGQPLVQTSGKQLKSSDEPVDSIIKKACSKQCYLLVARSSHGIKSSVESSEPLITFERRRRRRLPSTCEWKPLEKDLFLKGLEIFGNNSCLISSNLLTAYKTCSEVYSYMENNRDLVTQVTDVVNLSENNAGANSSDIKEPETMVRPKPRSARRKGRARRLKFSAKSGSRPSNVKKANGTETMCKQYTTCSCQGLCGKDCSCVVNGTCCEKYCGCSKGCKNRFRGCYCGKDQCRTQLCPCFAANRECDPDVCRNCWVSCGGGDLGEPPKQGHGPCGNMKILLRQQQRILLGRSDVTGWGAFSKNSVEPNEYLGEYTGELISHYEADKRGKMYDRANSSFLFDLNDQYVLDASRQGNKLKFANHSTNPNCCCKVMLVGGDHRVGIFAKKKIEAEEELFYDYRYGPAQAPVWAQRQTETKDNKDEAGPSQTRARKHQSR